MNIIRQIDVFDNLTENLVEEIMITTINLENFRTRFKIEPYDPEMYKPYEITEFTADLFPDIRFDFNKFSYYLAAYQQ